MLCLFCIIPVILVCYLLTEGLLCYLFDSIGLNRNVREVFCLSGLNLMIVVENA